MRLMDWVSEGMFARSKAGHDKSRLYVIASMDDSYVYLADGDLRPLAKPKKKKLMHIQPEKRVMDGWDKANVRDEDVRRAIRLHEKET